MISFLWPWALALLVAVPLLVWLYRKGLRPPAQAVALHPDLALLARAASRSRWRHGPAALYLTACGLALLAVARPALPVPEAHPSAAIILALDSSWSMRADDIQPTRLDAAKAAVHAFLDDVPRNTRVGLVTFGYSANVVSPPTTDHERLRRAVELMTLQRGTAIGDALLASMSALPTLAEREAVGEPESLATIILLSDGQNRGGIDPLEALAEVRRNRITVHTVGVGTTAGSTSPGFGRAFRFDEATLRRIASETDGRYVFVDSASDLHDVYRDLGRALAWRMVPEEATALASLGAAVLLLAGLAWGERRRRVY